MQHEEEQILITDKRFYLGQTLGEIGQSASRHGSKSRTPHYRAAHESDEANICLNCPLPDCRLDNDSYEGRRPRCPLTVQKRKWKVEARNARKAAKSD